MAEPFVTRRSRVRGGDVLRGDSIPAVIPRLTYSGRDGELRLYEGSTPPYYLSIPFVQMNFLASSIARPRPPDPIAITVGGYFHTVDQQSEQGIFAPVPISFSCWIDDSCNSWKLRKAMGNPDRDATWQVGTTLWTSTAGRGSVIATDGSYAALGAFYEGNAVDLEVLWIRRQSEYNFGIRCQELYLPPENQAINETEDSVELTVKGLAYGNLSLIREFTAGNAVPD